MKKISFLLAFLLIFGTPAKAETEILAPASDANTTPAGQIQRGMQIWPVDILTNILALPAKLMLWNWNFSNHHIGMKTENDLRQFLAAHPELSSLKVRLNAYDPVDDMRRLFTNREVFLPLRLLDFPFALINPFLGRFVGGIIVSDFYDPFSHTVYIYSDDPAIALHEAGHAYDYSIHDYKGLYAVSRLLPFNAIFQEQEATDHAIRFYQDKGMTKEEIHAYKTLYPAYFSYIGGILPVYPVGYLGAILVGHVYGRSIARSKEQGYEKIAEPSQKDN